MKITDELFYNIPTLPIQKFLFGEKLSKELDFSSKTYLLYAMDWSNDITDFNKFN